MAAELPTPLDDLTGLPLPLLPSAEPLPLDNTVTANWHHHFHPSTHPAMRETLGGRALRNSRIQLVDASQHNYSETAYHRFYSGPTIPEDTATQFGMCVMAAAGYVPELAIDTTNGEPSVKRMTTAQIGSLTTRAELVLPPACRIRHYSKKQSIDFKTAERRLLAKRETYTFFNYRNLRYGYDNLRAFFGEYVLQQDIGHIAARVRDPFLVSGDEEKGMILLSQAAKQAVDETTYQGQSLQAVYSAARDAGRLHPNMPQMASTLVKYKLGAPDDRRALLPQLRRSIEHNQFAA